MKNKFKHLLSTVDLLNTLNGGVSEPYVSFRERPDGRELRVRVPGVSKELLQVEIHDNQLSVYYHFPMITSGKKVFLPKEVTKQTLPFFLGPLGWVAGAGRHKAACLASRRILADPGNKRWRISANGAFCCFRPSGRSAAGAGNRFGPGKAVSLPDPPVIG